MQESTNSNLSKLQSLWEKIKLWETPVTNTRSSVGNVLSSPYRTSGISDKEKAISELRLEEGYDNALKTQAAFELLGPGEKAPSFAQVMDVFTSEMLQAAKEFKEPRLILTTKGRSFNDLIAAMNAHKIKPDQDDAYVEKRLKRHADRKLDNWGAYIVEGAKDVGIQDFDDNELDLKKRLARFTSYKKANGVGGMDRWKYAQLMMQALSEGRTIGTPGSNTILDEDPALSMFVIPSAQWNWHPGHHGASFSWLYDERHYGSRLRRSVGGDMPNS